MALFSLDGVAPSVPAAGTWWAAPTAALIGDVRLSPGASVWFGAVLRGDNDPLIVGEDTNIQDGCILHTDPGLPLILGRGVTVGHGVTLHGCQIGDNSLIGMGSTVLNGAVIGRNCLIGAGALITERKRIPDNSIVFGAPAKIVGETDEDHHAAFRRSAESYRLKAARYGAGLSIYTSA